MVDTTLSQIKQGDSGVNIVVTIIKKDEVIPYKTKPNAQGIVNEGRVAHCTVIDVDGTKGYLSLWNNDIEGYDVGDVVRLTNGFAKLYDGNVNLTTGFKGMLNKVKWGC